MPPIFLAVESAESRSLPLSAQRLVNFFWERQSDQAKSQVPLFGAPGIAPFTMAGDGPIRGFWNVQETLYAVSGDKLYSVDAAGNVTQRGDGIAGSNPVGMSDNGVQLCVVNGVQGWILDLASFDFTLIADDAFYPAKSVQFNDGYFVFDRAGTNQWFISNLYDGLTYSGLDFATAEAQPGIVQATVQNVQLLFIFTSTHIELWYDAGTAEFPFQRYAGGVIDYGTISPYTIIKQDGAVFFLGRDHVFYRMDSNQPTRVSTHAVEHIITEAANITDAYCTTYTWEGHKFVNLTLPALGRTLTFDIATQSWHERESFGANYQSLGIWRGAAAIAVFDDVYIGDAFSGRIGKIDWTLFTEFGNQIIGEIYSAPLHADRKRVFLHTFELDIQAGVGVATGQGSDPKIMLARSKDGGVTFGTLEPWRSMGRIGARLQRLRWLRNGNARQWVMKLVVSDPVRRVVLAAHGEWDVGI